MEKSQIFFFGFSFILGFLMYMYKYEYTPENKLKEYFIFTSAIIFGGLIIIYVFDVLFLKYDFIDILTGKLFPLRSITALVMYSLITAIVFSLVSDIVVPIVKLFKKDKKFKTPNLKKYK